MRGFFTKVLIAVLALSVVALACSLIIDPYGITGLIKIKGINEKKIYQSNREQIFKPLAAYRMQPDVLIIGSSIAQYGFDPLTVQTLTGKLCYNLAIDGPTIFELNAFTHFALKNLRSEEFIVVLDLMMFNGRRGRSNSRFRPERAQIDLSKSWLGYLSLKETYYLFFSATSLYHSLMTVLIQGGNVYYDARGFMPNQKYKKNRTYNYQLIFNYSTEAYAGMFENKIQTYYELSDKTSTFNFLRNMLEELYRKNKKVSIIIPPMHNHFIAELKRRGLWAKLIEWKSSLGEVNSEVAKKLYAKEFRIYDFLIVDQGFEDFPVEEKPMQYWEDAFHFSKLLGDQLLTRIYER